MLKVFCFYMSKPFQTNKFAKVYPELEPFEPSVIRHIDILDKKGNIDIEEKQKIKPTVFTFDEK